MTSIARPSPTDRTAPPAGTAPIDRTAPHALHPRSIATRLRARLSGGLGSSTKSDRGDVPGWVLITLMTAGLVIVIWAIAAPALSGVFDQAIQRVTSF